MIGAIRHILAGILLGMGNGVAAQCIAGPYAFQPGERVTYEVAYNWGVVWVDAGVVEFRVDTLTRDGKHLFGFESHGESYRFYDWIYKVRDRFQSHVLSEGFYPVWFVRETSEGGYAVNNRYSFDWAAMEVVSETENTHKPRTIDTLDLESCTFDVLSAIYYARSIDFEGCVPGQQIPIRFIIDGEIHDLYIRFLGKEIKENRSGTGYLCYKFSAMLVEGTIFAGGEDLVVWVTADANKVPVMVEAKILIGSIKAYLTGFENLVEELNPVE